MKTDPFFAVLLDSEIRTKDQAEQLFVQKRGPDAERQLVVSIIDVDIGAQGLEKQIQKDPLLQLTITFVVGRSFNEGFRHGRASCDADAALITDEMDRTNQPDHLAKIMMVGVPRFGLPRSSRPSMRTTTTTSRINFVSWSVIHVAGLITALIGAVRGELQFTIIGLFLAAGTLALILLSRRAAKHSG